MERWNGIWIAGMILASLVGLFTGFGGCAGGRGSVPTADELYAAGALPEGTDVEAIRRGRAVFVTECGACHRLYQPGEFSTEEWRPIVRRMAGRASLGTGQAEDLSAYLAAASRASR